MTVSVNFPKSGMGIEEGTARRWLKAVGDKVRRGEVIDDNPNSLLKCLRRSG